MIISLGACQYKPSSETLATPPPNVIVIITDDQGWGDIGYHNPAVYTPNLDGLAENGAKFTRHYVMPQCTPTRVALFTGRYPGRFGTESLQASNQPAFPKGTFTMAQFFQDAGYQTFLCGKWHMGSNAEHGPNHFGFDESYGSLAGAVGMYDHRYRAGEFEYAWHRNHDTIPGHENGVHATDLVANEAVSIIKKDHEKPYFMYLAFHAPHTPLDERDEFVDTPTQLDPNNPEKWLREDSIRWFNDPQGKIQQEQDPEKRLLLAAVHHVDDAIGRVIKVLEETGQAENTLILFTSDNGPQVNWNGDAYPNDLHLTDFNQPIPMRGSKLDVYEGGIHVPGLAYWPGHISPKTVDAPMHVIDWLPTLAGVIDQEIADSIKLDGIDLSPAIFRGEELALREFYWVWNRNPNRWALQYGDWKMVHYGQSTPTQVGDWELFHLKNDPKETKNVAPDFPDIVRELHELFLIQHALDQAPS